MVSESEFGLGPTQLEIFKYNLISVWFNKITKKYLCVYNVYKAGVNEYNRIRWLDAYLTVLDNHQQEYVSYQTHANILFSQYLYDLLIYSL